MKIAFWSNSKKAGVTGCTTALAISSVLGYGMTLMLLENEYNPQGLSKYLLGYQQKETVFQNGGYFTMYNEPYKASSEVEKLLAKSSNRDIYDSKGIDIYNDRLFYIWPDSSLDKESFEIDFYYRLHPLLNGVDANSDLCFIDTAYNNMSTMEILNEVDLVAIVLKQDRDAIDLFFQNYESLKRKAFFILSGYQIINPITTETISRKYGIDPSRIAGIPYCKAYDQALQRGNVVEFIKSNYFTTKRYDIRCFIQALRKTNQMLMDSLDITLKPQRISYLYSQKQLGGGLW